MKKEFSAGGIVYQKIKNQKSLPAQAGKIKENNFLWLVCQHSQHKGWVFPKGLIGDHIDGESSEGTAVREVEEETGVKAKIIEKLKNSASYFYVWQGEKRFKTVYYFLMEYEGGDIKNHDHEMSAVEWLPIDEVKKRLTYKSDKAAFEEALDILKKL